MATLTKQEKEILIEQTNDLVQKMAGKKAKGFKYNKEDIFNQFVSAGYYGLVEAMEKYDPAKNDNFASYAKFYINKEMLDVKYTLGRNVRLPDSVFEAYKKINLAESIIEEMKSKHILEDSIDDIAKDSKFKAKNIRKVFDQINDLDESDISDDDQIRFISTITSLKVNNIKKVKLHTQSEASLDTPLGDDEHNSIGDMIVNNHIDIPFSDTTRLRAMLDDKIEKLEEIEINVINYRYFYNEEMQVSEFADSLGLTITQMNKVEKRALAKLRKLIER